MVQGRKLVQEEKMAIFIDFSHLMQFHFDAAQGFNFVTAIVKEH